MALVVWEDRRQHEAIRAILRADGLNFCDEDTWTEQESQSFANSQKYGADVRCPISLVAEACSSIDNDAQGPEQVLEHDPDFFWSSMGTSSLKDPNIESITFRTEHGLAVLRQIGIKAYQANYQAGSPVYPPCQVAISIGNGPFQLKPVCGLHHFAPNNKLQWFRLPDDLPPVTHFQVIFLGKRQYQREDHGLYHAIQEVRADAYLLNVLETLQFSQETPGCNRLPKFLEESSRFKSYREGTGVYDPLAKYDYDSGDEKIEVEKNAPSWSNWSVDLKSNCKTSLNSRLQRMFEKHSKPGS